MRGKIPNALEVETGAGALSMIQQLTPCRASSDAKVNQTGPAPITSTWLDVEANTGRESTIGRVETADKIDSPASALPRSFDAEVQFHLFLLQLLSKEGPVLILFARRYGVIQTADFS